MIQIIQPETRLPKELIIKIYTALLTQTSNIPPIQTILHNTQGATPLWTYENPGQYRVSFEEPDFDWARTTVQMQQTAGINTQINVEIGTNYIEIQTYIFTTGGPAQTQLLDGLLTKTPITISTYKIN